jgi:TPP-dependent pyruvate/acetoin dehydrogenase alpha subunit
VTFCHAPYTITEEVDFGVLMNSSQNIECTKAVSKGLALELYHTMILIRGFELKAREVFRTGRMPVSGSPFSDTH